VWEGGFAGEFSDWSSGAPGDSDCTGLSAWFGGDTGESTGGIWHAEPCGEWFPYICER